MQRIFVAGAQGQVARAVARVYAARGDTATCAGRSIVDIGDGSAIFSAIANYHPDLIVNTAAYTAVDGAEDDVDAAFRVNRDGAAHVAAAGRATGSPVIHISTDYVFDGSKAEPYVETDATNPLGVYGRSKLAGEQAVAENANDFVILRTSWVCGPDGANFVKTMLRLAGERDSIGVVDDQWGCVTFAADLATAIAAVGDALLSTRERSALSGTYHAAGTGETTWCRFAHAIMNAAARRGAPSCHVRAITTSEHPTKAERPANSRLDSSKLADVFGVRLPDWRCSLERCLDAIFNVEK